MRNSTENLYKILALSLLGALLASGPAQAEPRTYGKTITFTLPITTPASAAPRRSYAPANTKYSNVRLQRAGNQVGVETLKTSHEGITIPSQQMRRR